MSSESWSAAIDRNAPRNAWEPLSDHRARLALEKEERAQRRRSELEELRSNLNLPATRVRVWEKMHGLRMPAAETHPILEIIAASTGLTLAEVQGEQQARRTPKQSTEAASVPADVTA